MSNLKFAIIGCGRIGQRHAGHIQHAGTLVAVCDIDAAKAEELGKKYNAKTYTSIEELLVTEKDLDVIAVCTPNGLHAEHSIKASYFGIIAYSCIFSHCHVSAKPHKDFTHKPVIAIKGQ